MSKAFGIAFGCAVAVIAVLVWIGFSSTKGNHLAPVGTIGKVRVQKVTDDICFVVIDFNVKNDSDRDMVVHNVSMSVDRPEGTIDGSQVAASDLDGAFKSYPELGQKFNEVMKERDSVPAHGEVDRMVAARFDLPAEKVEERRKVTLRVEDVTGPVLLLTK
jgi:hypothetical protein